MATKDYDTTWERPSAFRNIYVKYSIYIFVGFMIAWGLYEVRITPERFLLGAENAWGFITSTYPPMYDDPRRLGLLWEGITETIYIAMVATVTGIALSIPIAFMAAENISPKPLYYINRFIITIARALHALIVAIIFVKAFGFGAFAGVMTLTFKSIGFFSKLLAEDIEDIDMGQIEAMRATGASTLPILLYAVVPQIFPRFIGLAVYRWDINIRASTIIGIVGAGGIGATLVSSFDLYEYDFTATILISIIAIVLVAEFVSALVRKRVE